MLEYGTPEYDDAIQVALDRIIEGWEMVLDPTWEPKQALPYHGEDDPYVVAARFGVVYATRVA
jgi:hypothetical protein